MSENYLGLSVAEQFRKQTVLREKVQEFDKEAVKAEASFLRKFNLMFPRKKAQKKTLEQTSK